MQAPTQKLVFVADDGRRIEEEIVAFGMAVTPEEIAAFDERVKARVLELESVDNTTTTP